MDLAMTYELLQNPASLEDALLRFLTDQGIEITKNKSFGRVSRYDSRALTGINNIDYFSGTPVNFNTNLLGTFTTKEGEPAVFTNLRWYEGSNATVNKTPWVPGASDVDVLNGRLTINNNGVVQNKFTPMTSFVRSPENPFSGQIELGFPEIWVGQEEVTIKLETPVNVAAANINGRFEFIGLGLVS